MRAIDGIELGELFIAFTVMREVMVTIGDIGSGDVDGRRIIAVEQKSDAPGRVGLEGESGHLVHEFGFLHVGGWLRWV